MIRRTSFSVRDQDSEFRYDNLSLDSSASQISLQTNTYNHNALQFINL